MAILSENSGSKLDERTKLLLDMKLMTGFDEDTKGDVPPGGTYRATIIAIEDRMGVDYPEFDPPHNLVKTNLTSFLFGFREENGTPHKIATRWMKISGHENSNLMKFLTALIGCKPRMGWDYKSLEGTQCCLTVENVEGKYARIITATKLPPEPKADPVKAVKDQPAKLAEAEAPKPPPQAPPARKAKRDPLPF